MKNITTCVVTMLLFISSNIGIYHYLIGANNKQHLFRLTVFQECVKSIVLNDLDSATNKINSNKSFNLFKNFTSTNNTTNKFDDISVNSIDIVDNTIKISNINGVVVFDSQELKETMDRLIPSYINYKISINNKIIAISSDLKQTYISKAVYQINDNSSFTIELGIKPDTSYFIKSKSRFDRYYTKATIISLSFIIIILIIHLRMKNKLQAKIANLEDHLFEQCQKSKNFVEHKIVEQKLKNLFIDKIAKLSLNRALTETNITNINPIMPLLPIALFDSTKDHIIVDELFADIKNYFKIESATVALKLKSDIKFLDVTCAKEIFYQQIFSLISNLIAFMNEQSQQPKTLCLSINQKQIIISFDSFALNEAQMLFLSDDIYKQRQEPFLLNCRALFQSFKDHSIAYYITNINETENNFTIILEKTEKLIDNATILKFPKKKVND